MFSVVWCTDLLLVPDAQVTVKDMEIHVDHLEDKEANALYRFNGCVKVKVFHLPDRTVKVDKTFCRGLDDPIRI